MANTKSATKEIRVAGARQERNKSMRSLTKTIVHKAESAVSKGEESAQADVKAAASSLDKAAGAGIIHANAAARKKSRLTKKLNKAVATKK
ncbi:MAG: 30S ribosomal protein S20 [Dehalococcoidia bacterium]|nr:MAG: 30S ribosomal protein S20 [Dehalococcoidia bacterium]